MKNKKIKGRLNTMGSDVATVRKELVSLKNRLRQGVLIGGLVLMLFGFFKDLLYSRLTWYCADGIGGQQKVMIVVGLVLILMSVVKKK